MRIVAGLTLIGGLIASSAYAVDGVLEINQACAAGAGCFSGDTAGFPVQIITLGSYRLTSNLTPPDQSTTLISITAAGVSVDLNGFAIQGTNTDTVTPCSTGVGVNTSASDVVVSNGHVRGMGLHGVNLLGTNSRVERVIAELNCEHGIVVGNASLVIDSVARRNGRQGIFANPTSRVSNSVAELNDASGIFGSGGAVTVEGCVANGNGVTGIEIGSPSSGSLVLSSMANQNGVDGIHVSDGSLVLRSSANGNNQRGIDATSGSGVGFITANGNGIANIFGSPTLVACVVVGGAQSCP